MTLFRSTTSRGALALVLVAAAASARADTELSSAANLVDQGDYTMAITRLAALIEKRPDTEAATEALFHLGRAYEGLGSTAEALERYAEYLVRAPGGEYESEALAAFRRLYAAQETQYPDEESLERRLAALREAHEANPGDVEPGLELADHLWRLERYDEAAAVYRALLERDPAVREDPNFRNRIEIGPDGETVVLTPDEQARRDVEARPVAVYNTNSYMGGRDLLTQKPRWYIVTGEVINRSERLVTNVEVETRIYAFGNTIYDTDIERIGPLRPGQSRAFTSRFAGFEEINNVSRYECIVTYD